MITKEHPKERADRRTVLSTLWIVVVSNMLMADILSLYIPGSLDQVVSIAGNTPVSQLMLGASLGIEIPIAMILFSRVLRHRTNRLVNIITSVMTIAFVICGGVSYPHYWVAAAVEVVCALAVIRTAWQWSHE
jgi:hypothetical protein